MDNGPAGVGKTDQAVTTGAFVFVSGDDADDVGHCGGTACGGLYPAALSKAISESRSGGTGILAIGVNGSSARLSFDSWNATANGGPGAAVTFVNDTGVIGSVDFSSYAMIYLPSSYRHTGGGITAAQIAALNARQADVADFVNNLGGSLMALTQANTSGAWGWLPVPLTTQDMSFTNVSVTAELQAISPATNNTNMDHCCFHNVFTGPAGYSGLSVLAYNPGNGKPVILGGTRVVLTAEVCDDNDDNDGDGLVDNDDPDCQVCGDGDLDPGEECDDGGIENGDGCSDTCQLENTAPEVDAGGDAAVPEGTLFTRAGSFVDPDADTWTATVDYGDGADAEALALSGQSFTLEHTYGDNGVYTVEVTVTDSHGASDVATFQVTVSNVAPSVGPIATVLDPVPVGTDVGAGADFTDPGFLDTHTAEWSWGDGATSTGVVTETDGSGAVVGSHVYNEAGIYTIEVTVTDDDGGVGESVFQYVVVYDPAGGFVTGGGWIDSPAGAYPADPALVGKANFGFVAKYKKGATVPTGTTQFQFQAGDLNFHSSSYQWLVIAGARAQFKGEGTINGVAGYGFMLVGIDAGQPGGGDSDAFRIKIWDKATGEVVYDNQLGADDDSGAATALGGGSIVIHNKK
jgi:cysteine-rich repeat protein